ncbi:ATPase-AAA-core domain-containing protein [Mycena venus]|uniref:ATPase-AAA-core domain-containing protein n=1 Tax=Mycena venus TaxID=2733690 RepID=A0A8H6YYD9_9AGAR|nr:ATPase-AAA-core domain-containing protein [Mycena venus]
MNCQAEIHKLKSEYLEARKIHTQILKEASVSHEPYRHALALLNIVELDLSLGAPRADVQLSIDTAKSIMKTLGEMRSATWCDVLQADLNLREEDVLSAKAIFCKCLNFSWGKYSDIVTYCLERLGDTARWGTTDLTVNWTILFLVHAGKLKQKLNIHKALQFLGDSMLSEGDKDAAVILFTTALEGFTRMDVHHSKAECMLRLGNISRENGDLTKAAELWNTARPLFERSSQVNQIFDIDKNLAATCLAMAEVHNKGLTDLSERRVPVEFSVMPTAIPEES